MDTASFIVHIKNCLFNNKTILRSQQVFKSDHYDAYTLEITKIVLSSNNDKRLQTFDKITTYPHRTNAVKVCESKSDDGERLFG